ncbi:hypothetical protein LTR97_000861 [Elasticomyces elasticus]|uniref:Uncharacterized protein n=1 Tax=Elasticomyces elasticus TaxID=574655 RepID=A0AAN7WJJ2_9PEZI|nr:hypothetical protein LTR97_000861 [Elasticomyces elasticus]
MNKRKQATSDEPQQSKRSRVHTTLPFRNKRTHMHGTPQGQSTTRQRVSSAHLVAVASARWPGPGGGGQVGEDESDENQVSNDQESHHLSAAELSIKAAEMKIVDNEYDNEWNGFEEEEEEVTDAWSITSDNGHSDSERPIPAQIRAEAMRTVVKFWGNASVNELLGDDIIPKEARKPSGLLKSKTRKADPIITNLPVDRWSTAIKVALADLASVVDVRRASHHLRSPQRREGPALSHNDEYGQEPEQNPGIGECPVEGLKEFAWKCSYPN